MKSKRVLSLFLSALLVLLILTGCGNGGAASSSGSSAGSLSAPASGSIQVTDMEGREVTLDSVASKVVVLAPADCEILYALGAGDTLVGRGQYCDYPQEVLEVAEVQSGDETNTEQILSLEPDVIIMSSMAQTPEQVQALEDAGIPVLVSDAQNIEGVYTAIEMIGTVVGKTAEADTLVQEMKDAFQQVQDKVPTDAAGQTVYFETSPLEFGLWTAGNSTFMDEIATMLGLTNIFADVESWGEVSQEQVIERNPDFIITTTMYFGEGPLPVDEVKTRDGWQDITAIQQGHVFNADSNEITRPGPRLINAVEALYDFVYGDA